MAGLIATGVQATLAPKAEADITAFGSMRAVKLCKPKFDRCTKGQPTGE